VATATAAGRAGVWRARPLGARAHVDTNGLGAAGLPTRSGRGGGADAAVLAVRVAMAAAVVVVVFFSRT